MFVPVTGLKNEEIAEFNAARSDYTKAKYTSSALRISTLVENKMREFIYSVFILQYGDSNHRLQRIPKIFHSIITDHRGKDKERGLAPSQNELTYLNRQHYFEILVGRYGDYNGIGYNNWINTFSKIFAGWDLMKMRSYLNIFYQLNLVSAHHKEVLTGINQSDVYQYLIDSVRLLVMINKSYYTFVETVKKSEIPGSADMGYYFSISENKYSVQPVRKTSINETRIMDLLKESINTIDLSCPSSLEQKYGIGYGELFAILADILNGVTTISQFKMTKKNDPVIVLQVK